jgi:hypothetical protein
MYVIYQKKRLRSGAAFATNKVKWDFLKIDEKTIRFCGLSQMLHTRDATRFVPFDFMRGRFCLSEAISSAGAARSGNIGYAGRNSCMPSVVIAFCYFCRVQLCIVNPPLKLPLTHTAPGKCKSDFSRRINPSLVAVSSA